MADYHTQVHSAIKNHIQTLSGSIFNELVHLTHSAPPTLDASHTHGVLPYNYTKDFKFNREREENAPLYNVFILEKSRSLP